MRILILEDEPLMQLGLEQALADCPACLNCVAASQTTDKSSYLAQETGIELTKR